MSTAQIARHAGPFCRGELQELTNRCYRLARVAGTDPLWVDCYSVMCVRLDTIDALVARLALDLPTMVIRQSEGVATPTDRWDTAADEKHLCRDWLPADREDGFTRGELRVLCARCEFFGAANLAEWKDDYHDLRMIFERLSNYMARLEVDRVTVNPEETCETAAG